MKNLNGFQPIISTFSVLVQKKHGVLSKVFVRLEGSGYPVVKHTIKSSPEPDLEIIEFEVKGQLPLPLKLSKSITDIPECVELIDGSGGKVIHNKEQDFKLISKGFASQVIAAFPNVEKTLEQAVKAVDESQRNKLLRNLGVYTGSAIYKDKYSLGLPIKIAPFIKRAIVPTLKPLAQVSFTKDSISLENCICCSTDPESTKCEFVFGLLQGMLYENVATRNVKVLKTACRSKSNSVCTFVFD